MPASPKPQRGTAMTHDAEMGLALLKSCVAEHDFDTSLRSGSDHNWKRCRRCLAMEEFETNVGQRAVKAFLDAVT